MAAAAVLGAGAAQAQFFVGPYTWSQGQPTQQIQSGDKYVCVLTRVSGHFQGAGEKVLLSLAQPSPVWLLGGSSQQAGVTASSYCFRLDQFVSSGTARMQSGEFSRTAAAGSKCATSTGNTWWGDGATFLTGMSGNFAGGGESVSITQASGGFTPSILNVKTCQPYIGGFAHAVFIGKPQSGSVAQFWGPNGQGSAAVAGEYTAYATSLNPNKMTSVPMAPVDEAMCYLTRIGGKFRGGGEFVEIIPQVNGSGVNVWTLRARSGQSDGVWAASRCYRRKQS